MSNQDTYDLSNIDPDEISEVLLKIGTSFHVKFRDKEFEKVETFGDLCNLVVSKVQGVHFDDCSSQQTFYKVRDAISMVQQRDKAEITPDTDLQLLFPRHDRNKKMRMLQLQLGVSFDILNIKDWLAYLILGGSVVSIAAFFFQWQLAILGLILFITIGWISVKFFAKEFELTTIRQLTEKLSREHYISLRRDPASINQNEIIIKVKELFKADLGLDDHLLKPEAKFG